MRVWYESLSARDQIALLVLAGALGLWLFMQVVFIQLDGRRARLSDDNLALADKLTRVYL